MGKWGGKGEDDTARFIDFWPLERAALGDRTVSRHLTFSPDHGLEYMIYPAIEAD
jgi:hypothetical protein